MPIAVNITYIMNTLRRPVTSAYDDTRFELNITGVYVVGLLFFAFVF